MKYFALLVVAVLISCILMHAGGVNAIECPPPNNCALFDGSWTELSSCACVFFRGVSVPILATVVNPSKQVGSFFYRIGLNHSNYDLKSSFPDGFVNTFTLEKTESMNVMFQNNGTQTIQLALYYPGSPAIGYFVKGQAPKLQPAVAMNLEPLSSAIRFTSASYEQFNVCASAPGKLMISVYGNMKFIEFNRSGCQDVQAENYFGQLVYITNISNIKGATIRVFDQIF